MRNEKWVSGVTGRDGAIDRGEESYIVLRMIKKVTKVGNSHALILDSTLMGLMRLKAGDDLNVEIHEGGTMTVAAVREEIEAPAAAAAARRLISKNSELFRRLS